MGIGFVILIHLIVISILAAVIAIITGIATYFIANDKQKKRKLFLAIASPFLGLYVLYFTALFGSIILSAYKNIDIGIGDEWHVPLSNKCKISFIDVIENGNVECNDQTIISDVTQIQQVEGNIYGKTNNGEFFLYSIKLNKLKLFTKSEFDKILLKNKLPLKSAFDFYYDRRNEVAGFSLIVLGILSLMISIAAVYLLRKVVLRF
jgi:hypothetical protein